MSNTDLREQLEGNVTENATPSKTATLCAATGDFAERLSLSLKIATANLSGAADWNVKSALTLKNATTASKPPPDKNIFTIVMHVS